VVLQELQVFARRHALPAPAICTDIDGDHVFLYSKDKTRRYAYALTWEKDKHHLLWVMLNPGTGESEGRRRNTFERCKQWSTRMGYGGLIFGNVFSLRSKAAKDLLRLPHAADDLNMQSLALLSRLAPSTIVAWGNHGAKSDHPASLRTVLTNPKCFGYTKSGQPRHPLYVASSTPLVEWPRTGPAPSEA
jgi:hypothetical protein